MPGFFREPALGCPVSYSDKTAIWFHKPTLTNQPLFQVPLIGYITGSQGLLLFGVGLPAFFLVVGSHGLPAAPAPLAAAAALTMVRPPVLGYEGRLAVIIWFYLAKRRGALSPGAAPLPCRYPPRAPPYPRTSASRNPARPPPGPWLSAPPAARRDIPEPAHPGQPRQPSQG